MPPSQLHLFARVHGLEAYQALPVVDSRAYQLFQRDLVMQIEKSRGSGPGRSSSFKKTVQLVEYLREQKKHQIFGPGQPLYELRHSVRGQLEEVCRLGLQNEARVEFWEGMLRTHSLKKNIQQKAKFYFRIRHDDDVDVRE